MNLRFRFWTSVAGFVLPPVLVASTAFAQVGGSWGWTPGNGPTGATWGVPPPGVQPPGMRPPTATPVARTRTDLEIMSLYATATAYGAGTGVWIDAETGNSDPGLRFIPPGVLGVAGFVGVLFADDPALPRGVPAAISTGLLIGAGEGIGLWSYQYTRSNEGDQWGFKELSRTTFIGSTVGGLAGAALAFTQEPSPKTSLLLGSSVVWGAGIGSMFGYGSTEAGGGYGSANDGASLGGMIGYNLALLGAAGVSSVWVPSYGQLAYMWLGAGIGFAATSPVYLFYAGSDAPAKRGLVVQGVGTALGLATGLALSWQDTDNDVAENDPLRSPVPRIHLTNVGPMPLNGGMGAQLSGFIF